MKVYVMTKAKLFQAEQYMGVRPTRKSAEKSLRDAFPYMRKDGENSYVSDKEKTWLLFIHEEELG